MTSPFRLGVTALAVTLAMLAGTPEAGAKPFKKRFGWQNFTAKFQGGYQIGGPVGAAAGPAYIRIRAAKDGRSARVSWRNTFYTSSGSHVIAMQWNFRSDGIVTTTTLDPRVNSLPATGTFKLNRNHPVKFTVESATGVTATGQFRLIGGGALGITITLTSPTEGETFFGFTGGRAR